MATTNQFVRRPYPSMYEFLIDDFGDHLAKSKQAREVGRTLESSEEIEKAQRAKEDFLLLIKELSLYQSRELWAASRQVSEVLDGRSFMVD